MSKTTNENMQYWLIPSNQNLYDAIGAFSKFKIIDWGNGQNNAIKRDDIVYLYASKPIAAITIKAKVIKANFTKEECLNLDDSEFEKRIDAKVPETYFRLEFVKLTNKESLSIKELQKHGLSGNIQGKRTISGRLLEYILNNEDKNMKDTQKSSKFANLNQILYGPPGTGKTYNTINRALEIIDGEVSEDRSEAKARFEELSSAGQIEFVTFHQSYGYEEFVEGIKAIPVGQNGNEDGTEMIYAVSNGIFKNIAKVAQSSAISREKRYRLNAKALNIQAELIEEDDNTYRVLSGSKMRKGEAPSFKNYNYSSLKNKVLKEGKLREESEFYILESDYTFQSLSAASSVILGRQSNGFTDWVEVVENENKVQNKQNYILIIDEINRGNISKIFGELITLIEPSKRLGAEEEIRLRLPYSNELFGVPSNLYIIGTMNTADRSIALMDTALRRRFEFVEMMPNAELLDFEVEGVNLQELLEKINARVEYLYDRDHTIGHAYFMELNADSSLDALNAVMKNKIIPLLQEYFYDDWEKIRLILNDGFIRKTTQNAAAIFASGMDDEYIEEDKFLYSVAEEFTQESYLNLCQNR